MLSLYCRTQNTLFIICSAEDLLTLNNNNFRMVYKVDGNPQLDSRDWSMYSNILKSEIKTSWVAQVTLLPIKEVASKFLWPLEPPSGPICF